MAETGLLNPPTTDPVTTPATIEPVIEPQVPALVTPEAADQPQAEAATYEAVQREIKPEDTVAGQMEGLLASDSKYIERAEFKGQEYAQSRGLLNTSIAAGASTAAAIDAALPIAQQDADARLRQGLENQAAANTAASTVAQMQTQVATSNADILAQMERAKFSELAATGRQEIIAQTELQTLDAKINAERVALDTKIDAEDRKTFSTAYSDLSRQNDIEVSKIAINPDLNAAEKNRLITAQNNRYSSNVQLLADLYEIPIDVNFGAVDTGTTESTPPLLGDPVNIVTPEGDPLDSNLYPDGWTENTVTGNEVELVQRGGTLPGTPGITGREDWGYRDADGNFVVVSGYTPSSTTSVLEPLGYAIDSSGFPALEGVEGGR